MIKLHSDRAWGLPAVFAIAGTVAGVAGAVVVAGELRGISIHGPAMAGGVIATLFGGLVGYLGIAALREGGTYVRIDVAAGTLDYHAGRKSESFALDQLGALDVVQQHQRVTQSHRYRGELEIYELRAERASKPLFQSANREVVEQRRTELEGLMRESARLRAASDLR